MKALLSLFVILSSFNAMAASICTTDGPQLSEAKVYAEELPLAYYNNEGASILLTGSELAEVLESLEWNVTQFTSAFYSEKADKAYTFFLTCTGNWDIEEYIAD